jgi:hypothetical protein
MAEKIFEKSTVRENFKFILNIHLFSHVVGDNVLTYFKNK